MRYMIYLSRKKNVPVHILAPRRGCFGNHLPLRRVLILAERFYMIRCNSYHIRNSPPIGWRHRRFLRNQIIHHFQTRITLFDHHKNCLSTIRFYIILKLQLLIVLCIQCLSTIRFYIILKQLVLLAVQFPGLSTVRFYIILKHGAGCKKRAEV